MKESGSRRFTGFFGALLVALSFTLGLSGLARRFPPVNSDEAFLANHAFNLYHGHSNRYSLYDDLFEPSLQRYRDAQAGVLQIVYEAWIGPFVAGPYKSLELTRASSLVAGFLCLLLLYGLGANVTQRSAGGWVCMLLAAAHPMFWLSASLVRAEIPLLTAYVGLLFLIQVIPERYLWKYGLVGGLAGMTCGIHQNSAPFFMGLLTMALLHPSVQGRLFRFLILGLTYALGVAVLFSLINGPAFILSQQTGIYETL